MGLNTPDHDDFDADTGAEHQAEGKWNIFKGRLREYYAELTNDEMEQFKGNMQQLRGHIQENYGKVEGKVADWFDSYEEDEEEEMSAAA